MAYDSSKTMIIKMNGHHIFVYKDYYYIRKGDEDVISRYGRI